MEINRPGPQIKRMADFLFESMTARTPLFPRLLIGMEGAQTPAGSAGQGRPRRRLSAEEARRLPRGKRSVWNGNQPSHPHEKQGFSS
ncbi:Ribose 5-phosphate isomerase B [Bacillus badius]|nr:Ribose 5-phosphate isomerase B [Bacillus badius]